MAEYIERDRVVNWLKKVGHLLKSEHNHKEKTALVGKIIDHIENCPTADVVEVVRCRDCIRGYEGINGAGSITCRLYPMNETRRIKRPDDFCSSGERKNGR